MSYVLGIGLVCEGCGRTFSSIMPARATRYLARRVGWTRVQQGGPARALIDHCPTCRDATPSAAGPATPEAP